MIYEIMLFSFMGFVEIVVGTCLLALVFYPLNRTRWPTRPLQVAFITLSVLLVTPALLPGGPILMPAPMALVLTDIQTADDVVFMMRTWWFTLPSLAVTAVTSGLLARAIKPRPVSPASATGNTRARQSR